MQSAVSRGEKSRAGARTCFAFRLNSGYYRSRNEGAMKSGWKEYIASDYEILRGKPRLKGTRIPVSLVLGYLAEGKVPDEIIGEFPDLTHEQVAACLDYARDLEEFEAIA